jgi:uncharacterized protein (DUF2062 family)
MLRPALRRWLEQLLHTHDTPRRTAAAFALGVFFGFSPYLGLHTLLGLGFAFVLNLNRVAVLVGIYSNLPWILPAYYSITTLAGAALLQVEVPPGLLKELTEAVSSASWAGFRRIVIGLRPLLGAYFVGSTIGSIVLAVAAYWLSLALIVAHRRHTGHPGQANL